MGQADGEQAWLALPLATSRRIVLREKRKGELELDVKDLAREAGDD